MSDDRIGEDKMTTKKIDLNREYLGTDYLSAVKLIQLATKAKTENIFNVILEAYECGYKTGLQQTNETAQTDRG